MGLGPTLGIRACALALLVGASPMAGCEHQASLGALDGPDAGEGEAAAGEWLSTPLFDSQGGSQEAFEALNDAVFGHSFAGGTVYDTDRIDRFEVDFHPDGRFSTRCLDEGPCEPFGAGSLGDDAGAFLLTTLDASELGLGELRLGVEGPPYVLPAYNIAFREEGGVLTFSMPRVLSLAHGYEVVPVASTVLIRDDTGRSAP